MSPQMERNFDSDWLNKVDDRDAHKKEPKLRLGFRGSLGMK